MASSLPLKYWCSLTALLCLATSCCRSEPDAVDIVARALTCFNDHYVYSSCQESYRLGAAGNINVPPQAANEYCGGPCLTETKLVLSCIDNILYNFRFYNGASIQDVKYTLNTGCGYSSKRGDFTVRQHLGEEPGEYGDYYYGHANKLTVSMYLFLFSLILAVGY